MNQLLLASQSPRRRELLATLGIEFQTLSADIDETPKNDETPSQYVLRLAKEKALAGLALKDNDRNYWVLGSDTSVVSEGVILGKPESEADFYRMMSLLSGRTHQVLTSIALVSIDQVMTRVVTTNVEFIPLTEPLIRAYWESGEPQDKAGGYGIQGLGSAMVTNVDGSYSAVVGLPLHETAHLLGQAGFSIWHGSLTL